MSNETLQTKQTYKTSFHAPQAAARKAAAAAGAGPGVAFPDVSCSPILEATANALRTLMKNGYRPKNSFIQKGGPGPGRFMDMVMYAAGLKEKADEEQQAAGSSGGSTFTFEDLFDAPPVCYVKEHIIRSNGI